MIENAATEFVWYDFLLVVSALTLFCVNFVSYGFRQVAASLAEIATFNNPFHLTPR